MVIAAAIASLVGAFLAGYICGFFCWPQFIYTAILDLAEKAHFYKAPDENITGGE